jgi:hypothetical protein
MGGATSRMGWQYVDGFKLPHFCGFELLNDTRGLSCLKDYHRKVVEAAIAKGTHRPRICAVLACGDIDADLSEMTLSLVVLERCANLVEFEPSIEHRLEPVHFDRADHVFLVGAAADGNAVDA